jgi:hypothetical protein
MKKASFPAVPIAPHLLRTKSSPAQCDGRGSKPGGKDRDTVPP